MEASGSSVGSCRAEWTGDLGWQMGSPKERKHQRFVALQGQILKGQFLGVPGLCLERSLWPWHGNSAVTDSRLMATRRL